MSTRATRATRKPSRARVALNLHVIAGPCAGKRFKGTKARMTIGRKGACDVSAKGDDGVSERHGEIRYDAAREAWVIYDVGSSNGTDVDGVALDDGGDGVVLRDGSVIKLGRDTTMVARVGPGAGAAEGDIGADACGASHAVGTDVEVETIDGVESVETLAAPKSAGKIGGGRRGAAGASARGKRASVVAPTEISASRKRARADTTTSTADVDAARTATTTTTNAVIVDADADADADDENVAPNVVAKTPKPTTPKPTAPSQPHMHTTVPSVETYCRAERDAALESIRADAAERVRELRGRARVLVDAVRPPPHRPRSDAAV